MSTSPGSVCQELDPLMIQRNPVCNPKELVAAWHCMCQPYQRGLGCLIFDQNSLHISDPDWVFKSWVLALSQKTPSLPRCFQVQILTPICKCIGEDERTLGKNYWKLVTPVNFILSTSAVCLELIQHFSLNRNLVWNSWRHRNSLCYYKCVCHSDNIWLYSSLGIRL